MTRAPIDREDAARTIAAIASPPGGGRRGVVRLSGPATRAIVEACSRFEADARLTRRGVYRARLSDARGEQPALVLWMPGPSSYTREDVAELHLPGAPQLVEAALERVLALGARLAAPGEFTRRAFENGRLDLTRAEGVLELVRASNERERRAASALLFGGLAEHVAALRERLLELRVLCEASLDFDEADTGHVPLEELDALARAALSAFDATLGFERRRVRPASRPRVVLCGAPNAGKSTLFNALSGGRALVSEHAHATRDVLRAAWRVGEHELELVDTAGLDERLARGEHGEAPDAQAQRRARAELDAADLVLLVVRARPAGSPRDEHAEPFAGLALAPANAPKLLVWAQCDRERSPPAPPREVVASSGGPPWIAVSARTGQGLEALARACVDVLERGAQTGEAASAPEISERHERALREARDALEEARNGLGAGAPLDLVAQGVRRALDALDGISGRTSPEDVLERLFARFCIGK